MSYRQTVPDISPADARSLMKFHAQPREPPPTYAIFMSLTLPFSYIIVTSEKENSSYLKKVYHIIIKKSIKIKKATSPKYKKISHFSIDKAKRR